VNVQERLNWLIDAAEQLEIGVRIEHLGGLGGGLCVLKSGRLLFVDADADLHTQYEITLGAVGSLRELYDRHIPPAIAEDLERIDGASREDGRDQSNHSP